MSADSTVTASHASMPFDVFITYRRGDGRAAALLLRERLVTYRLPKPLATDASRRRPLSVFLDLQHVRPSADFWETEIAPALVGANLLIVVFTPECPPAGRGWLRELGVAGNPRVPPARQP